MSLSLSLSFRSVLPRKTGIGCLDGEKPCLLGEEEEEEGRRHASQIKMRRERKVERERGGEPSVRLGKWRNKMAKDWIFMDGFFALWALVLSVRACTFNLFHALLLIVRV